jgi:hypothetical protein
MKSPSTWPLIPLSGSGACAAGASFVLTVTEEKGVGWLSRTRVRRRQKASRKRRRI